MSDMTQEQITARIAEFERIAAKRRGKLGLEQNVADIEAEIERLRSKLTGQNPTEPV